jgi:2,3-bisphosphoglycerate-independent phosphoglycerate mutase
MLLLRGFARLPSWPTLLEMFKIRSAAIASYPAYRGLAKLVGMTALPSGSTIQDSLASVREHWDRFDFFFLHYKETDRDGEDGDFEAKVAAIEALDSAIPALLDLEPDVLMVAGDHSTPAVMRGHSWHPVPFMMRARWTRSDTAGHFNEVDLLRGALGTFPATDALPLALAHAGRFKKYGG